MPDYFDNYGFNEFYLKSARAANKNNLLKCFYGAWMDYFGPVNAIEYQTRSNVKVAWKNAKAKKAIKDKLLYQGFTSATIDGLYKKFSEWIKKTC